MKTARLYPVRMIAWMMTATALCCWLAGTRATAAEAAEAPAGVTHAFKMKLTSTLQSEILGEKQAIESVAQVQYFWHSAQRVRTLTAGSFSVEGTVNGKPMVSMFLSHKGVVNIRDGKTNTIPYDTAPAEGRQKFDETFGAPICKLRVDKDGREVGREIVALPGAKNLVDGGYIANATLFHPPYFADKDEWSADTQVSMGNGGYGTGKLTYRRKPGKESQSVTVSGTLVGEDFTAPGSKTTIKLARYVVTGEQTFDAAKKEWVSGRLTMDVLLQTEFQGKRIGNSTGKILAEFEMLPAK